jgi:aldose 1-epimerase
MAPVELEAGGCRVVNDPGHGGSLLRFRDRWEGAPVGSRTVDAAYGERAGPLEVVWPDRSLVLGNQLSAELSFTHVYTLLEAEFFCVEPVSQIPDAVNRAERRERTGLRWLGPGERLGVEAAYRARRLG